MLPRNSKFQLACAINSISRLWFRKKVKLTVLLLWSLLFGCQSLAFLSDLSPDVIFSPDRAPEKVVLHQFYFDSNSGSPAYLSAQLPEKSIPELLESLSLQNSLDQQSMNRRLLVVKQPTKTNSFRVAGLILAAKNSFSDTLPQFMSGAECYLSAYEHVPFGDDLTHVYTVDGRINTHCSEFVLPDGSTVPFDSSAFKNRYHWKELTLIEIPPLSTEEERNRENTGSLPSGSEDLQKILGNTYVGGGTGPKFDFKPGGGGMSGLTDIVVTHAPFLKPSLSGDKSRDELENGVVFEITDAQGNQHKRFFDMEQGRELLRDIEDGDQLIERLRGTQVAVQVGTAEELSVVCRQAMEQMERTLQPDTTSAPRTVPGIVSCPNGRQGEGGSSGDKSGSGQGTSGASDSGCSSSSGCGSGGGCSSGGTGGGDREDEDEPPVKQKGQCEIPVIIEMEQEKEIFTFNFLDHKGQEHTVELLSRDGAINNFKCMICLNVCNNASSMCNSHIYCMSCLNQLRDERCPECRHAGQINTVGFADRQIRQLAVNCPNKDGGCESTPTISELEDHYRNCEYQVTVCSNDGCSFYGTLRELVEHRTECPWQVIDCINSDAGCEETVLFKEMAFHLDKCQFMYVSCPNAGCQIELYRFEESSHQNECSFALISCDNEGCSDILMRLDMATHKETVCQSQLVGCPYCDELTARFELEQHTLGCTMRPEQCAFCDGLVPAGESGEHLIDCVENFQPECDDCKKLTKVIGTGFKRQISASKQVEEELRSKLLRIESSYCNLEQQVGMLAQQCEELLKQRQGMSEPPREPGKLIPLETVQIGQCVMRRIPGKKKTYNVIHNSHASDVTPGSTCILLSSDDINQLCHEGHFFRVFKTYLQGYHMSITIQKTDEHMSMYCQLIKGEHDHSLSWPLRKMIEIGTINRLGDFCYPHQFTLAPHEAARPVEGSDVCGRGYSRFCSLTEIHDRMTGEGNLAICFKLGKATAGF